MRDLTRQMQSLLKETKKEEDQKVIDLTDPTPFRTEIEQESQSMCDDCEVVDYKEKNEKETREEFAQVPVKVEAASYYRPEVRFERSDFGVVFLVGLVFLAVMLLICNC